MAIYERRFITTDYSGEDRFRMGRNKNGTAPGTEFPVTHPIKIRPDKHQRSITPILAD